ncbi:hypothetical protein Pst134EB_012243 [Puccinia striiformis f. sp. tritici]|nr:hypothetical protein Pst134EB_012243 [Puccinia striiformis f. sp. tritici]
MHSFFKSRSSKNKTSPNPPTSDRIPVVQTTQLSVDELGRPTSSPQLFHTQNSTSEGLHPTSQTFNHSDAELQLIYGYIGLHTEIELDLPTAARAVNLVAQELKSRALETPLLFSTHALDISTEGTHNLIRRFVHNQHDFTHDLTMHNGHNLAAFLKWILSRYVNGRGTHGFLQWEQYASWRESEKAFGYPLRFLSTHLTAHMTAPAASLLTCLLDLFASASVRADMNGMTAHKCAALFGAYIFGLEEDKPFEHTYTHWLRQSHATEHLIFAHMRDLKAQSPTGKLPLRMETTIAGYPSIIPSLIKTHSSARLEKVARFQRLTSFYSKNLISSAGTWSVARSTTWDRLKPYPEIGAAQYLNHSKAGLPADPSKLLIAPSYKHLLNIKGQMNLDNEEDDFLGSTNFDGPQRFKTLVEKEWSGFMNRGFQEPDGKKLEFNLDESSNAKLKMKRQTMDWDSFTGAGFIGRETYRPTDLDFNANIQKTPPPSTAPSCSKRGLSKKLIKTSKAPSVFDYDTTPNELPSLFVDENFFEAWADVLISSGWCRDELKEVSWALIHCKCKPADHQEYEFRPTPSNPDGRNDDMWALFEEVIPAEYQAAQLNAQKVANSKGNRRSFLRVITRKKSPNGPPSERVQCTPEPSLQYYPIAPASLAPSMSNSISHSSSTPTAPSCESVVSRATSTTPQSGHVGLFRSLSKAIKGGHHPMSAANATHAAQLHTMTLDAESVDELDASCLQNPTANKLEPWVNVSANGGSSQSRSGTSSDTTRDLHGSRSPHPDRPSNPTPPPSDRPRSTSTSSSQDFTPHSDHEGLIQDDNHSSALSRSIASSSDFTVELAERRESTQIRPASLIPFKNINGNLPARNSPANIVPNDLVYDPSNGSLPHRPKDEKFQYNQPNEPLRTPSSIASSTHSNTSSSSVDRMDCLNSFPQPQHRPSEGGEEDQRLEHQQSVKGQLPSRGEAHQKNRRQQQVYQKPEAQLDQNQKQFLQSTPQREQSLASPLLIKPSLIKAGVHFESPASVKDDALHAPLRKLGSPLGPIVGGNHYSNSPTLPPQFDRKARNVSNIVNLFEKAQPDIPLKQEQDKDGRPPMPPTYEIPEHRPSHVGSPMRIPVRSLKLSRVGEQEER